MPVRLTGTAISKAVRDVCEAEIRKDLADAGCPSLRLRLAPTGGKSRVLACRDRLGGMRRFPVGSYPDMGVSEGRDEARAMHAKVKAGADPMANRRRSTTATSTPAIILSSQTFGRTTFTRRIWRALCRPRSNANSATKNAIHLPPSVSGVTSGHFAKMAARRTGSCFRVTVILARTTCARD